MAWAYTLNQAGSSNADVVYRIKEYLKTIGWTVPRSGTGTAGSYNASGDSITSSSMATSNAWFCVRHTATGREICFQTTNGTTAYRIKLSPAAGFTGGSPSATQVSSATDEGVYKGSGTDASPAGVTILTGAATTVHLIGDATTGAWVALGSAIVGGGAYLPGLCWFFDPLLPGSYPAEDPSPFVFQAYGLAGELFGANTLTSTSSAVVPQARAPDGTIQPMPAVRYADTAIRIPGGLVNPYNGKDIAWPINWAREGAIAGAGWKGQSAILKWLGRDNVLFGTFATINHAKDHLVVGDVLVPWDGSTTPTNASAENLLSPVVDSVRGYAASQATGANQGAVVAGPVAGVSARLFDGTNDSLSTGTVTSLDLAMAQAQWTIECFFKPTAIGGASQAIISLAGSPTVESLATNAQMSLHVNVSGKLRVIWESTAAGTNTDLNSTAGSALIAGTWYHLAAVKNATHVRFYVDGVFIDQVAWTTNADGGTSAVWTIGANGPPATGFEFCNGAACQVRVSSVARSDAEVAASAALLSTTARLPIDASAHALWTLGGVETLEVVEYLTSGRAENQGGPYTVAGTWTGYSGDGSGIAVEVFDKVTGRRVATATTAVGGTYSAAVQNNTHLHFAEARQDGTHLGRTDDAYPA